MRIIYTHCYQYVIMLVLQVLFVICGIWLFCFFLTVAHTKWLLMKGKQPKHPYELITSIKKIKLQGITLNPFKLGFFSVLHV